MIKSLMKHFIVIINLTIAMEKKIHFIVVKDLKELNVNLVIIIIIIIKMEVIPAQNVIHGLFK